MRHYRLDFPAEVTAQAVADVVRVLVAEPGGRRLHPRHPATFATHLTAQKVEWWLHVDGRRALHLRQQAERVLPGLNWTENQPPNLVLTAAAEVRFDGPERLLDVDQAPASVYRLLGLARELSPTERVIVQWQVGARLPRPPIPPSRPPEPATIWNLNRPGFVGGS